MKNFTVLATFPEFPSAIAEQLESVDADDPGEAVNRAYQRMRRGRINGRKFSHVTFTVRAVDRQVEDLASAGTGGRR